MKIDLLLTGMLLVLMTSEAADQIITLDEGAISNLHLAYGKAENIALQNKIQGTGTVRLNEKKVYDVTAKIEGVVSRDTVSLGDQVEANDELCSLQSAKLSEMIVAYVAAEEEMTFSSAALDQEKKLKQKKLSSDEQLRDRELAFRQAVVAHTRALQPLKLLDFNEGTIHQYLHAGETKDYTTLSLKALAPGEVIEKSTRLGAAVSSGEHLFTIADLSSLWVEFHLALRDVPDLNEDADVSVFSTVTEKNRSARIIYISPLASVSSRTVTIRAVMDNSDRKWRPGTPVKVEIQLDGDGSALSIPSSAVVDLGKGKAVFAKIADNQFEVVAIEVGASDGARTVVRSGLEPNQEVVVKNAAQLKGHLEMTMEQ